jgi:hypothetical protein
MVRLFDAAISITMYYGRTRGCGNLCKMTNLIWNVDTKVLRKMFDYNAGLMIEPCPKVLWKGVCISI